MVQAIILLGVGILAVSFGIVMARRGYVTAYKDFYPSSSARLYWGVALILMGLGAIITHMTYAIGESYLRPAQHL